MARLGRHGWPCHAVLGCLLLACLCSGTAVSASAAKASASSSLAAESGSGSWAGGRRAGHSHGHGKQRSLAQIAETLQKLRKSLDDAGREDDELASKAAESCDKALRGARAEAELAGLAEARLRADAEEQEAAVEEAMAAAQSVRANIALVGHTLSQIQADPHFPPALADNKQQTLNSLKGELGVLLPALTAVQARASESKQRLGEHSRSTAEFADFVATLRQGCKLSVERAGNRSAANSQEAGSIDAALEALQKLIRTSNPASRTTAEQQQQQQQQQQVSFVQVARSSRRGADVDNDDDSAEEEDADGADEGQTTDQDLRSMFDASSAPAAQMPMAVPAVKVDESAKDEAEDEEASSSEDSGLPSLGASSSGEGGGAIDGDDANDDMQPLAVVATPPVGSRPAVLKPQVQHLLADLEANKASGDNQAEWCKQERLRTQLALRASNASADELSAEAEEHREAQAQIGEDLNRTKAVSNSISGWSKGFTALVAEEKKQLAKRAKDQGLATRILKQAVAILEEMQSAGRPTAAAAADAAGATSEALRAAHDSFAAQAAAAEAEQHHIGDAALDVAAGARHSLDSLAHETSSLELARKAHVAQQAASQDAQSRHNGQLQDLQTYLKQLEEECRSEPGDLPEHLRTAEIRALEDAKSVLDGRAPTQPPAPAAADASGGDSDAAAAAGSDGGSGPGLRGSATPRPLSPLERAAAEMGIPLEGA